jgi:hypothetical protein
MSILSGGDKLEAILADLAKKVSNASVLEVGFFEDATYPDGTPVALVAAVNEYGAPSRGIPPRPFMRTTIAENSGHWGSDVAKLLAANGMDAKVALGLMGIEIQEEVEQSIIDMDSPANSPVTNLLKQRFPSGGQTFADVLQARRDVAAGVIAPDGKPLVQSGLLLGSVRNKVT